ncbi:MAG: protein-glutamate O-methyltransferase CheR [Bdellovibrionaceae bacterium]|nr:protein-glutamate O-methyltransferase CheR [Pseudobdellovibrionaceae bacterium]
MSSEHIIDEIDEQTLVQFISLVHKHTGITLALNRKTMLQGRIKPRVRQLGLHGYKEYLALLESSREEIQILTDLVTTNETYFYRTPRIWSYLEKEYMPQWVESHSGGVFNAWSAAASSGEEAHTLGVVLQSIKTKRPALKYQILGSDISNDILNHAIKGEYSGRSIEQFRNDRPELFKGHMRPNGESGFSVESDVRKNIKFQQHNLFNTLKVKEKFDLVLLRNVLIYFEASDQEKVLFNVSQVMKPDGLLIIGESESLSRLATPFSYKMPLIYGLAANKKENAA